MLWDIFPEVYDMSQLPEEFTIILGVGIGIVLLIVLTLGIGCFCLEKKRRDNAMKLAAYLEEHRNEKFSQMELQERSTAEAKIQRQITTVLYADDEDDDAWTYTTTEPTDADDATPSIAVEAKLDGNAKDEKTKQPGTLRNWGMKTTFSF